MSILDSASRNSVYRGYEYYKDGKVIKNIDDIKLYKFKNFLFLELKNSYYHHINDITCI